MLLIFKKAGVIIIMLSVKIFNFSPFYLLLNI